MAENVTMWATLAIAAASIVMAYQATESAKTAAKAVEVSANLARAEVAYQALKDGSELEVQYRAGTTDVPGVLATIQAIWMQNELDVLPPLIWQYLDRDFCTFFNTNKTVANEWAIHREFYIQTFQTYIDQVIAREDGKCGV